MNRKSYGLMKMVALLGLLAITNLFAENSNNNIDEIISKKEVLLPIQANPSIVTYTNIQNVDTDLWDKFQQENGEWTIVNDKFTGTPHRAFGKSIQLDSYHNITSDNVEEASLTFLKKYESTFNINTDNIRLLRADYVNNKWYVSFRQYHGGLEVLFSEIELRIHKNGKVMAFGIDYFNDIDISLNPSLSLLQAKSIACGEELTEKNSNKVLGSDKLYIMPVKQYGKIEYKLTYKLNVDDSETFANYRTYVDAHNGSVVWKYNTVHNASTNIEITGGVKLTGYKDEEIEKNMPLQYVTVGSTKYTADEAGMLTVDIDEPTSVSAILEGPWVKVTTDKSIASFSGTITPVEDFSLAWSDNNSSRFERNMFYHTNYIYDYFKTLDPGLSVLDTQITVEIQYDDQYQMGPNAFSSIDYIAFTDVSDGNYLMADGPSVLFHEYGHSVNSLLYYSRTGEDMQSMACHEATADYTSATILNTEYIGKGVFKSNAEYYIRTLKNTNIFPDSVQNESHHDGQILGGAFWDLRELTSPEVTDKLVHFARYGLPDDPDLGTAFYEWLLEIILVDDDDDDLSNGTPHLAEIITAFNNHHIGTNLFLSMNFAHEAYRDTDETVDPYEIEFEFDNYIAMLMPENIQVVYYVNKPGSQSGPFYADANGNEGVYTAEIPAQDAGTLVKYHIEAIDDFDGSLIVLDNNLYSDEDYCFVVGYNIAHEDDFESADTEWETGHYNDDASIAVWEWGDPEEMAYSTTIIKPEDDHTEDGSNCFVTGIDSPEGNVTIWDLMDYLPDGTTTLTSPNYNLKPLENEIISFHYYLTLFSLALSYTDETNLTVELSNDGGDTWVEALILTESVDKWKKQYLFFSDYLTPTDKCRIRFVRKIEDVYMGWYSSAFALIDDLQILTTNRNDIHGVEDEAGMAAISARAYPNPSTDVVFIEYNLNETAPVNIKICNEIGNEVAAYDFESGYVGANTFVWDLNSFNGESLPAGMYYYSIKSGSHTYTGSIVKE